MKTTTTTTTGAGNLSAVQILNNLTLAQAYGHAATADKAAYIVELLGVKSIHSPLFVELEDAIEDRFHELRVADNRNGRKVYLAYVCGAASLRDAESDEIVHRFKGHRSYERHLPYAQIIAKANRWQLI